MKQNAPAVAAVLTPRRQAAVLADRYLDVMLGDFQTLLLLSATAGTGLGLLVSALSRRQERAVAAVPLLILPQILFSEFAIPREHFGKVTAMVENFMIVKWCYRIFVEAAKPEPGYLAILLAFLVLALMAAALLAASSATLTMSRGEDYL